MRICSASSLCQRQIMFTSLHTYMQRIRAAVTHLDNMMQSCGVPFRNWCLPRVWDYFWDCTRLVCKLSNLFIKKKNFSDEKWIENRQRSVPMTSQPSCRVMSSYLLPSCGKKDVPRVFAERNLKTFFLKFVTLTCCWHSSQTAWLTAAVPCLLNLSGQDSISQKRKCVRMHAMLWLTLLIITHTLLT